MGNEKLKTILLVDDEAIIAMSEKTALEKYGYDVITALSGEEALAVVEKTPAIDLILMDINLGSGMDGTDAAALILKNRDLPIVFLSSHMEPEVVAKTETITSYGYVVKNSSITVLDASIKMAFKLFAAKLKEKEKAAELRKNEHLLNFHVNNSPLATIEFSSDFVVKRWSGEAEKIFGWNQSETMGKSLMDLKMIYDEDIPLVEKILEQLSNGSAKHIVSTNRNCTKAGKVIICEWYNSVLLDPQEKMVSLMSQGIDITERRRTEAALRGSEERYKALFDRSLDLIYIHDFEGRFIDANNAALSRLGYTRDEIRALSFTSLLSEDQLPLALKTLREIQETGFQKDLTEFRLRHKNGSQVYVETQGSAILSQGSFSAIQAIARDITMRKQAEELLRINEERYRTLFETMDDGFCVIEMIYDPDGKAVDYRFVEINPAFEKHTGLQEAVGKTIRQMVPDHDAHWFEIYGKVVRTGEAIRFEKPANAMQRYYSVYAFPIDGDGSRQVGILFNDISERKRAEEALNESETRYRELFDNMGSGVAVYEVVDNGSDFIFNDFNRAGELLDGIRKEDVIGKSIFKARPGIEKFGLLEVFRRVFATGIPEHYQAKFYQDEQLQGWYDNFVYRLPSGEIVTVYDNISERKRAESQMEAALETLRISEEQMKKTQEIAHLGSWELDIPTEQLIWSDEVYRIFGLAPQEFVASYEAFLNAIHPQDRAAVDSAYSRSVQEGKDRYEIEHRIVRRPNGEVRNVHEKCEHFRDASGMIIRSVGMVQDITERKRAEEEIKRQLAEKEILLKEVHHRIKNNIASISGLISLRMQSVTNPAAVAVLKEAIGRVNNMRLLYDKMLLNENHKDIPVKNYLEDLIDTILALFPDQAKIKLDKRIAAFQLDAKRLFPLGSIINELLTNTMKYAFINRKTGLIKIFLAKVDNHVTLTFQDNGIGLPAGFDIEQSKGFGLMLVKMLSGQLGGSFSMEKGKGTRCKVEFDI